jgi:hypothetical protein
MSVPILSTILNIPPNLSSPMLRDCLSARVMEAGIKLWILASIPFEFGKTTLVKVISIDLD